jgi:hypothetical protein
MADASSDLQTRERSEPPSNEVTGGPAPGDQPMDQSQPAQQSAADAGMPMPVEGTMETPAEVLANPLAETEEERALSAEGGEAIPSDDAPDAFDPEKIETDGVLSTLPRNGGQRPVHTGPPVIIENRYEVHPSRPIPDLDSPSARAYEVIDRQNPHVGHFALVPIPGMPIRKREIDDIVGHSIPNVLPLIDTGVGDWPIYGRETIFLIFERPMGGRLLSVLRSDMPDFKRIDILRAVVDAIRNAVEQLNFRGLVHHAIRPDNIFFMDEELTQIVLGEFVSTPPSFDQPIAFETIDRAMAMEGGRGTGAISDDLYSFGATLAFLLQRSSPVRGMNREQLILAKMMNTSYQTLVGRHLLTPRFLELMRGLLHDDPAQRWMLDQIEQWSHGRRVALTQSNPQLRSPRPFRFGNIDHFQPRSLAYVMSQRRESAIKLIRDGTLETWVMRGLEDKDLAASIQGRIDMINAQRDLADADEILLTRVLLLLDPASPLRYKGLNFFPGGWGDLLAIEMMRDGDIRTLAEMVVREIPRIWFDAQMGGLAQNFIEETAFQRLRLYLQRTAPGYGLERCLYESNPSIPCKSPLLGTHYVAVIEDLLPVLNDAERGVDSKQRPLDRHLAAFIAARSNSDVEIFLEDFNHKDEAISAMAVLQLYSVLQAKFGPEILLGLTRWIGGQAGPIIRVFHSRETRRKLEAEIPQIVRRGSLPELLELLDDAETKANDQNGFAAAVAEFQKAEAEINDITTNSRPGSYKVQHDSRKAAAILSILFTMCIVSIIIMTR